MLLDNTNGASLFYIRRVYNLEIWHYITSTWTSNTAARYVGQVNLADSTSNEWYITGAQLEVGTSASDFDICLLM